MRRDVQPKNVRPTNRLTSIPREGERKMSGEGRIYLSGNQDRTSVIAGRQYSPRAVNSESIETRMANLRISEPVKYPTNYHGTTSPAFDTKSNQVPRARPNISSIQRRPLPPPGSSGAYRPIENIYQSPVRPSQDNRDFTGPRTRQNQEQKPTTRHSCDFSPTKSKLPLPRHYLHQPVPRQKEELSKSKAPGLGKRAATELEFSRPCVSGQLSRDQRVPSGGSSDHPAAEHGDSLVRKGLMWVQQDKLFSRWKERFIILTTGYLQIFKKGSSRISDMGSFVSKVRLSQVGTISPEDRRGYLTLILTTQRDGKILLRKPEGIKDWYNSIVHHSLLEKQTTQLKTTDQFWKSKQVTDSKNIQDWLLSRDRVNSSCQSPDLALVRRLSPQKQKRTDKFQLSYDNSSTSYFLPSTRRDMFGREDSGFESLATTSIGSASASFKHS